MDFNFYLNNNNNQSALINLDNYDSKPYSLHENLNVKNENKYSQLSGNFNETRLSKMYFSQENIDYLQQQIIERVNKINNGKYRVGLQSEDELLIVMRSIYLQNGKNVETHINQQINDLNEHVLDYCVDNVSSNLKQYFEYIKDITKEQPVLDMPQSVHIKGDKGLMPNHFF